MKHLHSVLILILVLIITAVAFFFLNPQKGNGPSIDQGSPVQLISPKENSVIKSPLLVGGMARGTWFFEADFPIRLLDANGQELTAGVARAVADWMTESYVPFQTKIEFPQPETDTGTLVLEKANPSGLSETEQKIEIPVRFK